MVFSLHSQTRSPKRGVSFNFTNEADLSALQYGTSWFYNWGTTPNNVTTTYHDVYGYEFCPMIWGGSWDENVIRNYVNAHPDCKYLLAWNEPNFRDQANLTPRQAADLWPSVKALAQELNLKIISPACNYSSWTEYGSPDLWLDEFFSYVDINDVDGIALHSYMGWASATEWYMSQYIQKYNKPIWLTEFCAWDNFWENGGGTALVQRREMIDLLEYLETEPMIARYAWFIPRRDEFTTPAYPYMELLTNTNGTERGVLTETGMVWTYMSSYDDSFYHDINTCIEAEHYIEKSNGIYMEQTTDDAGILNVYDYNAGGELVYNVDIPSSGEYTVRLRMCSERDASFRIIAGSAQIIQPFSSTSGIWENREVQINLEAGKQKVKLQLESGSVKLNYFVITDNGAYPEPMPNPGTGTPLPPNPEGPDYALHKPVESASAETDLQPAANITDGTNRQSRWESRHGEDNKQLIIDLETTVYISDIIIDWEGAYASEYRVWVSSDKNSWQEVFYTNTGESGEKRIVVEDIPARFIKIDCIARGTIYGFSIYEVEVYGSITAGISSGKDEKRPFFLDAGTGNLIVLTEELPEKVILSGINGSILYHGAQVRTIDMTLFEKGIYILTMQFSNGETIAGKISNK